MSDLFGRLKNGLRTHWNNQEGVVFPITLAVFIGLTSLLLWQINEYNRERLIVHQQKELLQLETLIQLGVVQALVDPKIEERTINVSDGVVTVRVNEANSFVDLHAVLKKGSERKARVYYEGKRIIQYEEGF